MQSEHIHTAVGVTGVVINSDDQVLLVLSRDRGWETPQGFLEAGESPIQALHREILEETGYRIKVNALTGLYHCIKDGMPVITICFLCEAGDLVSSKVEESLCVQWVDKEKLDALITRESYLLKAKDALSGQRSVTDYQFPFSVTRSMKFPNQANS